MTVHQIIQYITEYRPELLAEAVRYTWTFSQEEWNAIIAVGNARSVQKRGYQSTRQANWDSHEVGMIGEAHFGRLMGIEPNTDLNVLGDGKVDFGSNIDVKTTKWFREPWLRITPDDAKEDRIFPLVAVSLGTREARYCGYATTEMMLKAPMKKMHEAMPKSYVLSECHLIWDIPRG